MDSRACIDASLAVLWLFPTRRDASAESVLLEWDRAGTELLAPPLFEAELTSAIMRQVHAKRLLPRQGEEAFSLIRELGVRIVSRTGLQQKAWDLASKYGLPHTFYAQYLAVAEMEDCELWTANSRLFDSIKDKNNRIRLVRDDTADKSARAGRTSEAKTTGGQEFPGLWQRI